MKSPPRNHMSAYAVFAKNELMQTAYASAHTSPLKGAVFQAFAQADWVGPIVEDKINDLLDYADVIVSAGEQQDYNVAIKHMAPLVWGYLCASLASTNAQLGSLLTQDEFNKMQAARHAAESMSRSIHEMKYGTAPQSNGYPPQGAGMRTGHAPIPGLGSAGAYAGGYQPGARQQAMGAAVPVATRQGYNGYSNIPTPQQAVSRTGNTVSSIGEISAISAPEPIRRTDNWHPRVGALEETVNPSGGAAQPMPPVRTVAAQTPPKPKQTPREEMLSMFSPACFTDIKDLVIMEYSQHNIHALLPLMPVGGIPTTPFFPGADLMINRVADVVQRPTDGNSTLLTGGTRLAEVGGSYAYHLPHCAYLASDFVSVQRSLARAMDKYASHLDAADSTVIATISKVDETFLLTPELEDCFAVTRQAPVTHATILASLAQYRKLVQPAQYQAVLDEIDRYVNEAWTYKMGMPSHTRVDSYMTAAISGGELLRNNGFVAESTYWVEDLPSEIGHKLLQHRTSAELAIYFGDELLADVPGHGTLVQTIRVVKLPIGADQFVFGAETLCRALIRKDVVPSIHRLVTRLFENAGDVARILIATNDAQFMEVHKTIQPNVYSVHRTQG